MSHPTAYATFLLLGAFGCAPRNVLLGRGGADAGAGEAVMSTETAPAASSAPLSGASVTTAQSNTASSDGTGQSCEDLYETCNAKTGDPMCRDLQILCQLAPADGGTLGCPDVAAQCESLGYSQEECDRAVALCEEDSFTITPAIESEFGGETLGP